MAILPRLWEVFHRVTVIIQGYKFVVDFNVLHFLGGGGGRGSGPWHLVAVYIR